MNLVKKFDTFESKKRISLWKWRRNPNQKEKIPETNPREKYLNINKIEKKRGLRYNEVELLRAGEIADARVGDVGGLVSRNDVVPDTHPLSLSLSSVEP